MGRHRTLFVLIVWSIGTTACGVDADELFANQEPSLRQFATEWATVFSPNDHADFTRFGEGRYRWNGNFITSNGHGYSVIAGGDHRLANSLAEAAALTGTSEAELRKWDQAAALVHVYAVRFYAKGVVELMVSGSQRDPYGFLYVLPGEPEALVDLKRHAAAGKIDGIYWSLEFVRDGWFKFAGSH